MTDPRKIADAIQLDDGNANAGTIEGHEMLEKSIKTYGAGRSILIDAHGRVIAGNKTTEAALSLGLENVIIVETDGTELVAVKRTDLDLAGDDPTARLLAYADNRTSEINLLWDGEQVKLDLDAGLDLSDLFEQSDLDLILPGEDEDGGDGGGTDETGSVLDVPDAVFPSDNKWGIPTLDVTMAGEYAHLPFTKWGDVPRSRKLGAGMYHFYTDDYKFNALWRDPLDLVNSGVHAIVEPNFSTDDSRPLVEGLWAIYRKRWIARFCQKNGLRVFVDLAVAPPLREINLLGVPVGWAAWATRGADYMLNLVQADYELAVTHAGDGREILFIVYGGGAETETLAKSSGWLWFPENMHVKDGRFDGARAEKGAS